MTQEHPITPPPELVQEWARYATGYNIPGTVIKLIATKAARWGADQELEACRLWVSEESIYAARELVEARRPKPPTLKEQALKALQDQIDTAFMLSPEAEERADLIRRALESLPS